MIVGGTAGAVIMLVLSSVLNWAAHRHGSRGLNTAGFFVGFAGALGVFPAGVAAGYMAFQGPGGPVAGTGTSLLLLAGSIGVGGLLVGAILLYRIAPSPREGDPKLVSQGWGECLVVGVAADAIVAVLAALGAAGVLHLSAIRMIAWAYTGLVLGFLAALALAAVAWMVAAIAGA
jgi:hypothetical protein